MFELQLVEPEVNCSTFSMTLVAQSALVTFSLLVLQRASNTYQEKAKNR